MIARDPEQYVAIEIGRERVMLEPQLKERRIHEPAARFFFREHVLQVRRGNHREIERQLYRVQQSSNKTIARQESVWCRRRDLNPHKE